MRKVFIDGGANVGQSIEAFCNHYPNAEEFEIHSFEAGQSPDVIYPLISKIEEFKDKVKSTEFHSKAVWIHDGNVVFCDSGDESSSIASVGRPFAKEEDQIEVECIDISSWIKNNFTKEDHIVFKLDIEGGEYDVIKKMYEDDTIDYIDRFYCEIHGAKCHKNFNESMALVNMVEEKGKTLYTWSAESYGKRDDTPYSEEMLRQEYKKWHINDIECAYKRGDGLPIPENELTHAVNIMIDNNIWKAKLKGTDIILDLTAGKTVVCLPHRTK